MPQSVLAGKTFFVQNQGRRPQSVTADKKTIKDLGGILTDNPDGASCIVVDQQALSLTGRSQSCADLVELGISRGVPLVDCSWVAACNSTGKEANYAEYAPWIIRARRALPRHGASYEDSGTARAASVGARTDVCARNATQPSSVSLPKLRSPIHELSTSPRHNFAPSPSSALFPPIRSPPPKRAASDPLPSFLKRTHTIDKLKRRRWAPPPPFPGRLALAGVASPLEAPESSSVPLANEPQSGQTLTYGADLVKPKRARRRRPSKPTKWTTGLLPSSKRSKVVNGALNGHNKSLARADNTSGYIGKGQVCLDTIAYTPSVHGSAVGINECTMEGKASVGSAIISPSSANDVGKHMAPSIPALAFEAGLCCADPAVLLSTLPSDTRTQVLWIADKLRLWIGLENVHEFLEAHAYDENIFNASETLEEHETLITVLVTTTTVDCHSWSVVEASISQLLASDYKSQDDDAVEAELEPREIRETDDLGEADMDICSEDDRDDTDECSVEVASPAAAGCSDTPSKELTTAGSTDS